MRWSRLWLALLLLPGAARAVPTNDRTLWPSPREGLETPVAEQTADSSPPGRPSC